MVIDCGSGHASVFWFQRDALGTIKQLRRSRVNSADKGPFKLAELLASGDNLSERIEQACELIRLEIESTLVQTGGLVPQPVLLFIGATGGVRDAITSGALAASTIEAFTAMLEAAFAETCPRVKFVVLPGAQEAMWELSAARAIWGAQANIMFAPPTGATSSQTAASVAPTRRLSRIQESQIEDASFGLFSGGGQSMQVGVHGSPPLSFPFSTWWPAIDEAKGASTEAWRDPAKWGAWEADLLATIASEKEKLPMLLGGCFVLTSMNERAADAAGLSETPIHAAEAVSRLRATLALFLTGDGAAYENYLAARRLYKYNVARVTAMHLCRLAHVLEKLFEADARLYAPQSGSNRAIQCEWSVGAFVEEARRVRDRRQSTVASFV